MSFRSAGGGVGACVFLMHACGCIPAYLGGFDGNYVWNRIGAGRTGCGAAEPDWTGLTGHGWVCFVAQSIPAA